MRYLTDKQVAKRLGVTRVTVWRWLREGLIPEPRKIGPRWSRWNEQELKEWLSKTREVPPDARELAEGGEP